MQASLQPGGIYAASEKVIARRLFLAEIFSDRIRVKNIKGEKVAGN